jgi:hypothetical protein
MLGDSLDEQHERDALVRIDRGVDVLKEAQQDDLAATDAASNELIVPYRAT